MKVTANLHVNLAIGFTVTEDEARALDAMVGYGDDAFIKVFYEKLGKAYMEKHEDGLRSFFASVRHHVPGFLSRADAAREAFYDRK